jgi:hypothetical protein
MNEVIQKKRTKERFKELTEKIMGRVHQTKRARRRENTGEKE